MYNIMKKTLGEASITGVQLRKCPRGERAEELCGKVPRPRTLLWQQPL